VTDVKCQGETGSLAFRATGWHPKRAPGWHRGIQLKRLAPDSERQLRKGACSESLHAVFNITADVQTSAGTAKVQVEPVSSRWMDTRARQKVA
jgi:hypothetical protein